MARRQVSLGKTSKQYFCLCGMDWNQGEEKPNHTPDGF